MPAQEASIALVPWDLRFALDNTQLDEALEFTVTDGEGAQSFRAHSAHLGMAIFEQRFWPFNLCSSSGASSVRGTRYYRY